MRRRWTHRVRWMALLAGAVVAAGVSGGCAGEKCQSDPFATVVYIGVSALAIFGGQDGCVTSSGRFCSDSPPLSNYDMMYECDRGCGRRSMNERRWVRERLGG